MKTYIITAILALSFLGACGHTKSDRALSGAAIGAGVGAAGSAVAGGNVGTGAIIGGAVGATAGALTNESDVDLGDPLWR